MKLPPCLKLCPDCNGTGRVSREHIITAGGNTTASGIHTKAMSWPEDCANCRRSVVLEDDGFRLPGDRDYTGNLVQREYYGVVFARTDRGVPHWVMKYIHRYNYLRRSNRVMELFIRLRSFFPS